MSEDRKSKRRSSKTPAQQSSGGAQGTPTESASAEETSAEAASTESASTESSPTDESAEPTPSEEKSPSAKPRIELPAFGFAADLLRAAGRGPQKATGAATDAEPSSSDEAIGSDEVSDRDAADETSEIDETALERQMLAAAIAEVDAEAPGRIFDFADRLAGGDDDEIVAPQRIETWLSFALDGETFALPVEPVRQVVRVAEITRVPHAPRPIRGVTNLRGRVIPVVDLRLRVGLDETPITRAARIIAVSSRGRLLGLLVDAVHQVIRIEADRIAPPPEDAITLQSEYISGVYQDDETLVLLLDVDRSLVLRGEAGAA